MKKKTEMYKLHLDAFMTGIVGENFQNGTKNQHKQNICFRRLYTCIRAILFIFRLLNRATNNSNKEQ